MTDSSFISELIISCSGPGAVPNRLSLSGPKADKNCCAFQPPVDDADTSAEPAEPSADPEETGAVSEEGGVLPKKAGTGPKEGGVLSKEAGACAEETCADDKAADTIAEVGLRVEKSKGWFVSDICVT